MAAAFILAFAAMSFLHFRERPSLPAEVWRLQITPTANMGGGDTFALSPDGRKLVFQGVDSGGAPRLWIRSLDSLEDRPLAGGDNPICPPFWSPDSRFVAFWNGTQLRKLDISGGPAANICDFESFVNGGSWNSNGVIIFGSNTPGIGLMQVSATGGSASPLTVVDSSRRETSHKYPSFLPDGRHFLYWRSSSLPDNNGLYVGLLDARPEEQNLKRLMPVTHGSAYIPSQESGPGQLLSYRGGMLISQPFDDRRLALTGEPVMVAEKVGSYIDTGYFSASTNGVLVYRSGGSRYFQATWRDRQGKPLGAIRESGLPYGMSLSPDGTRAAVGLMSTGQGPKLTHVWLFDFSRGENAPFTFGRGDNAFPIWSPDGSEIVFGSDREGGVNNLYRKPASGAEEEKLLLKSDESKLPTCWSSDRRFLLYTASRTKKNEDLWLLPLEGDRKPIPFLHTEFNEFDGRFSPDMRWVAYASDESGSNEIYVQGLSKISAGASVEKVGKWRISMGGGIGPRWRGDGKELYYFDQSGKVWAVGITGGSVFQKETPRCLFQMPVLLLPEQTISDSLSWDVAPDGNRFLVKELASESAPSPFTVILNWTSLLKK